MSRLTVKNLLDIVDSGRERVPMDRGDSAGARVHAPGPRSAYDDELEATR